MSDKILLVTDESGRVVWMTAAEGLDAEFLAREVLSLIKDGGCAAWVDLARVDHGINIDSRVAVEVVP